MSVSTVPEWRMCAGSIERSGGDGISVGSGTGTVMDSVFGAASLIRTSLGLVDNRLRTERKSLVNVVKFEV